MKTHTTANEVTTWDGSYVLFNHLTMSAPGIENEFRRALLELQEDVLESLLLWDTEEETVGLWARRLLDDFAASRNPPDEPCDPIKETDEVTTYLERRSIEKLQEIGLPNSKTVLVAQRLFCLEFIRKTIHARTVASHSMMTAYCMYAFFLGTPGMMSIRREGASAIV